MSAETLLSVRELSLDLAGRRLIDTLSFTIAAGETLALVGESGSGKTLTALSCIRLEPAEAVLTGAVSWRGQELLGLDETALTRVRGRGVGMLFQDAAGSLHPTRSLGVQLQRLLRRHQGLDRASARAGARQWLQRVGLDPGLHAACAHELSGGQAQRAALALALACGPQLLICDEPTSALDVSTQRQIMELLSELRAELGLSLLFITHDLALAAEYADRIAVMRAGRLCEIAPATQLWQAPQSAYGRALLACRPRVDRAVRRLPMVGADGSLIAGDERIRPAAVGGDAAEPLLQVSGLSYAYPARGWARWWGAREPVLSDVGFELVRGQTLGIVGESGSGKSTLARALIGLLRPSGELRFDGVDPRTLRGAALRRWRRRVQLVFQNPYTALNPALTIERQLQEPLLIHGLVHDRSAAAARVRTLLEEVGLPAECAQRYPDQFSGGQRQRLAIARALACEPELLICDESVSALDVSVQAQVLNLLADLRERRGLSLIFISHDLAVIRFLADEVLVLARGRVVERGPAADVFDAPQHAYTRALLHAIARGPV